jgi:hypothetical protein
MKKFNITIFAITVIILVFLNFASWSAVWLYETGDKTIALWRVLGSLTSILRFPIFTLFWKFLYSQNNVLLFSIAVFFNCVFYALIVERILSRFHKKPKFHPTPTAI